MANVLGLAQKGSMPHVNNASLSTCQFLLRLHSLGVIVKVSYVATRDMSGKRIL